MTQQTTGSKSSFTPMSRPMLQRKCACGGTPGASGECAACKKKREASQGMLQRAASNAGPVNEVPGIVHDVLRSSGQPLETGTREFMESRFGQDFSGVRVHTDSRAAESARAVNALAYTVGRDVVFGEGKYAPQTQAGQKLMAHELTHVMQQGQQSQNVMRKGLEVGSPDSVFERQADSMAEQVMQGSSRSVRGIKQSGSILQRACGPTAIGQPSGCEFQESDVDGPAYLFRVNCDEFAEGNELDLRAEAQNIQAGEVVEIHGLASSDGNHDFNVNLACARALRARGVIEQVLSQRGVSATIRVINHGPQEGSASSKRSVVIKRNTPQAPTPAPAPITPSTSPFTGKTIDIWINSFIPQDVPGYTYAVAAGRHAGKTAIPCPAGLANIPNPNCHHHGYLTDQREASECDQWLTFHLIH
jgi:hypothetical protein